MPLIFSAKILEPNIKQVYIYARFIAHFGNFVFRILVILDDQNHLLFVYLLILQVKTGKTEI